MKPIRQTCAFGFILGLSLMASATLSARKVGDTLSESDLKAATRNQITALKVGQLVAVPFNSSHYRLTEIFARQGLLGRTLVMDGRRVGDPLVYAKVVSAMKDVILIISTSQSGSQDNTAVNFNGDAYEISVGATAKVYAPTEIYILSE